MNTRPHDGRIEPGDLVTVRSGGPPMTVAKYVGGLVAPRFECVWFDHVGAVRRAEICEWALKRVSP